MNTALKLYKYKNLIDWLKYSYAYSSIRYNRSYAYKLKKENKYKTKNNNICVYVYTFLLKCLYLLPKQNIKIISVIQMLGNRQLIISHGGIYLCINLNY